MAQPSAGRNRPPRTSAKGGVPAKLRSGFVGSYRTPRARFSANSSGVSWKETRTT